MEFFASAPPGPDSDTLQAALRVATLSDYCASIDRVLEDNGSHGRIYCLWGEFAVTCEAIRHGVRFALPGCPNALAWTITAEDDGLRIHCTINRPSHEPDFIASIEEFVADWAAGLARLASA